MESTDSPRFASDSGSLRALLQRLGNADPAVLGVVVATQGSTYRKPGALIYLPEQGPRLGWLSGGCLEAELEQAAIDVAAEQRARHLRIDTRSDDDLVFGSASGCRGLVELLLLPLPPQCALRSALLALGEGGELELQLDAAGAGSAVHGERRWRWDGAASPQPAQWSLRLRAPPALLLLGAGPETDLLVPLAQRLGWRVDAVEPRMRWSSTVQAADLHVAQREQLPPRRYAAALVMSHHFSRDLENLRYCANGDTAWVGLLGPPARRDALLAELGDEERERLLPRLQAPAGLNLGGEGPEAIALAIVAALQRENSRRAG